MEYRKNGWRVDEEGLPEYVITHRDELKEKNFIYEA
jgi:hypothetical protein